MKDRHFTLIFTGLAGGLALLLAAEWLLPPTSAPPLPAPAIPAAAAGTGGDAAIGEWAETILARPVFNENRRPEAVVSTDTDAPPPRLSAIIIAGGARRAVFAAAGEKPEVVGEGGAIGGYQVKSISTHSVAVLGPDGGLTTLRLQYLTPPAVDVATGQ
jgi:hypothetical protein